MTATSTVQTPSAANYSVSELDRIQKWQSSNERLLALYWERRGNPRRNRGHSGCSHAWGDLPDRKTWHVVHDVAVAGGAVLSGGLIVPEVGAVVNNVPLAKVCCSRRQGRKALERARQRHPDARLICFSRVMSERSAMIPDRLVNTMSISANDGAPPDWWHVRSNARSAA